MPMLSSTRRASIVTELQQSGEVSVQHLADEFGVSASTIRRDLNALSKQGRLQRVRGGGSIEPDPRPFNQVAPAFADEKERIGRRAAELVSDGDVVILDIGTTVAQIARHLRGRRITVITASIAVVDLLRDDTDVELIVLGGVLRKSYLSLVGALTEQALSQITADICFLGASGVRDDGSVLDSTGIEVPMKHAILRASERSVFAVASDKFPGTGLLSICGPDRIDVVVTTSKGCPALDSLRSQKVSVIEA